MTKHDKHSEASAAIDSFLSDYDFNDVARTHEEKYQPWYAATLSGLALLVGDEKVVYAESNFATPPSRVRIVVITSGRVIMGNIDPGADSVPVLQMVSRKSLTRIELSAAERIDAKDNRARGWPGSVLAHLTYPALNSTVELVLANRPSRPVKPEITIGLIDELTGDLQASA